MFLFGFAFRVMLGIKTEVGSVPSSSIFSKKNVYRVGVISSYILDKIHQWSYLDLEFSLRESFW